MIDFELKMQLDRIEKKIDTLLQPKFSEADKKIATDMLDDLKTHRESHFIGESAKIATPQPIVKPPSSE